jgi:hypothetical protein
MARFVRGEREANDDGGRQRIDLARQHEALGHPSVTLRAIGVTSGAKAPTGVALLRAEVKLRAGGIHGTRFSSS